MLSQFTRGLLAPDPHGRGRRAAVTKRLAKHWLPQNAQASGWLSRQVLTRRRPERRFVSRSATPVRVVVVAAPEPISGTGG
jgi:hypothetical protein